MSMKLLSDSFKFSVYSFGNAKLEYFLVFKNNLMIF